MESVATSASSYESSGQGPSAFREAEAGLLDLQKKLVKLRTSLQKKKTETP